MKSMKPLAETAGGTVRVVDSNNFPAAKTIAGALFTVKPGALREIHWHPESEWQYYIGGSARMTVFGSAGEAHPLPRQSHRSGGSARSGCRAAPQTRGSSQRVKRTRQ